jgi:hypothetical protein
MKVVVFKSADPTTSSPALAKRYGHLYHALRRDRPVIALAA